MATYNLVVKSPFDGYTKGQLITDQIEIAAILDVNNPQHININKVNKVLINKNQSPQPIKQNAPIHKSQVQISTVSEPKKAFDMSSTSSPSTT